jgi:preprotein translocase subunit SecF
MELFRNTKFDFLGWKWPFIGGSVVLMCVGIGSLVMKGGPLYGIDFRGGAVMEVIWAGQPPVHRIRTALAAKIRGSVNVTETTDVQGVLIGIDERDEGRLDKARRTMTETLAATFSPDVSKPDFNNASQDTLVSRLRDPLQRANVALSEEQLRKLAAAMLDFKNTQRSGVLRSFEELSGVPGVTPAVMSVLKQECTLAPFGVRRTDVVGAKVGADLRGQAIRATLYALAGMLVYIAFRFEWIYGVAAVVAVFHDTIITIGLFSLFNREIDLTVVAAILTLVGYSMNDTIVVFDRIRENLKILRRESLSSLINISVNQTLSRTVLTSGLTFLTAISLLLFGGSVLHGFSFALVVGILIGTYSSVFVASPILVFWQDFVDARQKTVRAAVAAGKDKGLRSDLSRGPERPKARKG